MTGDWSGTGTIKIGVFLPDSGRWYLDRSGNRAYDGPAIDAMYDFGGITGALPVAGVRPEVVPKIGVFVPATGRWYLDKSGNGAWDDTPTDAFYTFGGLPGALPVAGDWSGSGTAKIGVFVPDTGKWYLDLSGNGAWDDTPTDTLDTFGGIPGAVPIAGK